MGRHAALGPSVKLAIGTCVVAVGFLAAGVSAALAGPVSCGAVLTTNTKLQNDLANCPGDGLVIGADGITVDLNGHTVDGLGAAAPFGSAGIDNNGGYDGVVVKNGTVKEFRQGLVLVGTTGDVARGLRVTDNVSDGFFVDGFADLDSNANRLVGNRVSGNGEGITLRGSNDNLILGNSSTANRDYGIALTFSSQSNSIDANVLGRNGQGVFLYDLADGNELAGNLITDNGLTGVLVAGSNRNRITINRIARNAEGISVVTGDFPLGSDENVLARNVLVANAGDGIFVYGPWEFMGQQFPGATDTVVLGNDADGNGDDGIDVRSAATTITRNGADRNADLGIDAVAGVTDGGGNHASGNGNPLQCVNVAC